MLYTEDFTMRHYVGFSQIGSHMYCNMYIVEFLNMIGWNLNSLDHTYIVTLHKLHYT